MTLLPSRTVSHSTLRLTEVGLGCAQLGNLYRTVSDDEATATLDKAWELGGPLLRHCAPLRARPLRAQTRRRARQAGTRGVRRLDEGRSTTRGADAPYGRDEDFDVPATQRRVWDFSRDGILCSLEQSLERLALDHIDIVYLHDPDDHWPEALREAYPALEELRDQGVVSSIGAGMNQAEMLADFVRHTDMDVLMVAGRYTLLEQGALDELLPLCVDRGVGVVAAGVFNSGVLARDDPPDDAKHNYERASGEIVERARRIADVCRRYGVSLPGAAIAFPLAHPAIVSVCLGARSPEQIERNVDLYRRPIPAGLWRELGSEGLLRDDTPTPTR